MEEHRFDLYRGVLFSEILGLITGGRANGPKDTFDGSAQSKPPSEVDSNEVLVLCRVEGRTGVQVESEIMVKCEGNNNESACDMLCWM